MASFDPIDIHYVLIIYLPCSVQLEQWSPSIASPIHSSPYEWPDYSPDKLAIESPTASYGLDPTRSSSSTLLPSP